MQIQNKLNFEPQIESYTYTSWDQTEFPPFDELFALLQERKTEIKLLKEQFRQLAIPLTGFQCKRNRKEGVSGSYFLVDENGSRKFVIKPLDEDAGCIHSRFYFTPDLDCPFRDYMPLYRSSMREALAYQVAQTIGVESIIPKTALGIIESDKFYDFSESIPYSERAHYLEVCGPADKEKLVSFQEYVADGKPLFEALHEFQMNSLTDEEIASRIDQQDFEEANILIWTTFDTDAHMGNILVYPKKTDAIGNEILGLKKIDNGLAFPDKNYGLINALRYLPNAEKELSLSAKTKILNIDVNKLSLQFEKMELQSARAALQERIVALKELASQDGITIKQINKALSKIGKNK